MSVRVLTAVLTAAALAGPFAAPAAAQTGTDKAQRALDQAARGRMVCGFLHFGATYLSHQKIGSGSVSDKPGYTYLQYRYNWKVDAATDNTTVYFFFDASGRLAGTRVGTTTAVLNQPYVLAQAAIKALGELAYEAIKNDLNASGKNFLRDLVDRADAKGLMELVLYVQLLNSK